MPTCLAAPLPVTTHACLLLSFFLLSLYSHLQPTCICVPMPMPVCTHTCQLVPDHAWLYLLWPPLPTCLCNESGEWFFLFYFILVLMLATCLQLYPPALCPHLSVLMPANPHTPAYTCVLPCIHLPACTPHLLTCTQPHLATPVVAAPACLPPQ